MAISSLTALATNLFEGGKNLVNGVFTTHLATFVNTVISTVNELVTAVNTLTDGSSGESNLAGTTVYYKAGTPVATATVPGAKGEVYINSLTGLAYFSDAATAATDFKLVGMDADVQTNATDIATNHASIGTNTTNIATNAADIATLETGSATGISFGGITLWTKAGVPDATPTGVGDIWIDTTNGDLYIADAATAASDFNLVTRAA